MTHCVGFKLTGEKTEPLFIESLSGVRLLEMNRPDSYQKSLANQKARRGHQQLSPKHTEAEAGDAPKLDGILGLYSEFQNKKEPRMTGKICFLVS